MFICLTCKADEACVNYTALPEKGFGHVCPTKGCDGTLLQIDDGIAEAIVALNDKGYPTEDSCSGHFNNCEGILACYVVFENGKAPSPDSLPEGFVFEPGGPGGVHGDSIFYYDGNGGMPAAFFKEGSRTLQVMDVNRRLLEWALALPARAESSAEAACLERWERAIRLEDEERQRQRIGAPSGRMEATP